MSIETMTDQEKSIALARLCGWFAPAGEGFLSGLWKLDTGGNHMLDGFFSKSGEFLPDDFDLYDPASMALAWRVLNWAMLGKGGGRVNILRPMSAGVFVTTMATEMCNYFKDAQLWFVSPDDAQATWLDKIMTLAIEARMVETAVSQEAS